MPTSVYVKVVGFNDVERHALNTLFRLSQGQSATYLLWTPELPVPPHVALIDVESYEAGMELDLNTPAEFRAHLEGESLASQRRRNRHCARRLREHLQRLPVEHLVARACL